MRFYSFTLVCEDKKHRLTNGETNMTILTIEQRFNQSSKSKNTLKQLQKQHSKSLSSFKWKQHRPTLDLIHDMIAIKDLYIDTKTQRDPFSESRVPKLKQIVQSPCAKQFKRIIVSNRKWKTNSQYVVVEGQGRVLSAYAMGETSVPYDLYEFASEREEASFFLRQGKDIQTIRNYEKHAVILNIPDHKTHKLALDLERVVSNTIIEYEPQKIDLVDCSNAYSGIKEAVQKSKIAKKGKPGSRDVTVAISIINLMIKYCKVPNSTLILRSDLFYPMIAFVASYKKEPTGITKLEEKIKSLQATHGKRLTIDDLAIACSLNICKNPADKRSRYKSIKKW